MQWKRRDSYQEIAGRECVIVLERRPHYCDRGNFIAKLFTIGKLAREIDHHDGWPRYYFDEERAKAEVEAWLTKRGQAMSDGPASASNTSATESTSG